MHNQGSIYWGRQGGSFNVDDSQLTSYSLQLWMNIYKTTLPQTFQLPSPQKTLNFIYDIAVVKRYIITSLPHNFALAFVLCTFGKCSPPIHTS